jgi:DNA uptake protein ComE-like DNA-binding protein
MHATSEPRDPRVLSADSPTRCSPKGACNGRGLRAARGASSAATRDPVLKPLVHIFLITAFGVGVAARLSTFGGVRAHAQDPLPDAPGKEQVVAVCSKCHEPQRVAALRLTREGWEEVVAKMQTLGAKASEEDFQKITDYLSENFKGEAPKPINLNSATSVDLESVAGLLRKEAAAWIDWRTKHGSCNALDDLKKVPGVPFKKIDERRDRLVCLILTPQVPQ